MASRSENNSPNHENQNENDKSDVNGVLRQRKTISPSHSRRSSAPNLKFLQEQQTSTNSNRFVDYSVYVEDLEKTEIIGLIQQRQIPVKSDLPVTHISVMKNALR